MQQSRFSVLTGHLNDYPLADLVGILRHQQKTGRLLLEYEKSPAMLFFKDGELIDAQFDQLSGLQALCVVFAQPTASFNFNPLVRPQRRTIDSSLQKAVSELLGCWDESAIDVDSIGRETKTLSSGSMSEQRLPVTVFESVPALMGSTKPILSLPPAPTRRLSPSVMAMGAAGLLMLGASAFIGVSRGFIPATPSAAANQIVSAPIEGTAPSHTATEEVPETLTRNRTEREAFTRLGEKRAPVTPSKSETVPQTEASPDAIPAENAAQTQVTAVNPEPPAQGGTVRVILQVENGRVTQASIGNHKPGMEAYEALALRIARQRRYPAAASGQQTVMIRVD
ncbi:MAG TPA: DUF4388 domain-containing protein [Pyrinomonadaceae bacterium]|nr:DUF4388 domain-containing protein [Pyrinomonadaceae bacterium]